MTTDTTVIQPGVGQSILTTDHRDHGRHDHDHGFRETRLDADYRALIAQGERFGTINGDRINTSTQVTGDRVNTAAAAAALASGRTDQLVGAGFGGVHDRLCDGFGNVTAAVSHGSEESQENFATLQKQLSDTATATVVGFKDAQAISYQIEGRASLDAAKNAAALGLQATTNANALSVEATKNAYQASLEAVKNASAAQLEAQRNASEIAKQLAECCCELRTQAAANLAAITATVVAGNQAIMGKMDQTTIDNLRAQLVATQRLIPVTVPVGAG